ncbi:GrpB-like predicted nucleotidyltransferase (UPF0157 family) [Paenibacillus cellulosilyticus]|uniref:GrpB-like predicted nucleotidyltransferase (UPF0157 family) n=1 Tax=Paenibacillus cellulosilyticus TaxID=375489 RepID=A0A2V2YRM0_9BACL|nr:GrpB family protein [Paenibacillus cellulosilyticus]PWW00697.1 GrpB-like predicted nucleotidyltransferase (UPF0157 family) [Paenibacillus cellulosilyticus]
METVKIEGYNENWPLMFQEEKRQVEEIMTDKAIAIEHIGSTAVPGLSAKTVIDFMVGVKDLAEVEAFIEPLARIGYEHVVHKEFPNRRFFRKGQWRAGTHHLHVYVYGSEEWDHQLAFRDYLRDHSEAMMQYDQLKRELADKYPHDRAAYTNAKHPFITEILARVKL